MPTSANAPPICELLIHDVITKPFTLATICGAVREALGAKKLH